VLEQPRTELIVDPRVVGQSRLAGVVVVVARIVQRRERRIGRTGEAHPDEVRDDPIEGRHGIQQISLHELAGVRVAVRATVDAEVHPPGEPLVEGATDATTTAEEVRDLDTPSLRPRLWPVASVESRARPKRYGTAHGFQNVERVRCASGRSWNVRSVA
jgi:hypothetical protein